VSTVIVIFAISRYTNKILSLVRVIFFFVDRYIFKRLQISPFKCTELVYILGKKIMHLKRAIQYKEGIITSIAFIWFKRIQTCTQCIVRFKNILIKSDYEKQ
jgi:hypothetical protein